MPDQPNFSVVVPAYNATGTLAGCLQALRKLNVRDPYEVIVVDDGSTDDSARVAQRFGPPVTLLRTEHRGAAAARNAGVEIAKGEVILFTDADCEPTPEWAAVLLGAIRDRADGAKGTYRTRQRSLVARFVQAEYESKYRHMEGRERIDFIDTYSAAYRRDVLLSAGGFNESLPVDEDQELSFRLAESGKKLVFAPEAVVYHRHVSTIAGYVRRKFRIGYWKVFVGTMHPQRMVSDSHTPQSMRLEIGLVGAGLLAVAAAPFWKAARLTGLACGAGFCLTSLPFTVRAAMVDPVVGAIAPGMLLLRAVALGAGVAAGTLRLALLHLRKG